MRHATKKSDGRLRESFIGLSGRGGELCHVGGARVETGVLGRFGMWLG